MTTKPNLITHDGQTLSVNAWAKHLGISRAALNYRLKQGWPLEKALSSELHTYRVNDKSRTTELLAYRSHHRSMQDDFDNLVTAFVRAVESDAREMRRQMRAMIAARTGVPDDVFKAPGVVSFASKEASDRLLSSMQETI